MEIRDTSSVDKIIHKRKYNIIYLLFGIVTFFFILAYFNWLHGYKKVNFGSLRTQVVKYKDFSKELSVQGHVISENKLELYAPEDGVFSLIKKSGQSVSKDQMIGKIINIDIKKELRALRNNIDEMEEEIKRKELLKEEALLNLNHEIKLARIEFKSEKIKLTKQKKLYNKNIISEYQYQIQKEKVKEKNLILEHLEEKIVLKTRMLDHELKEKQIKLAAKIDEEEEIEERILNLNVTSNIDGTMADVAVEDGAQVNMKQYLGSVVDLQDVSIVVDIPEYLSNILHNGMQTKIKLSGYTYDGYLDEIFGDIQNNMIRGIVKFTRTRPTNVMLNQKVQVALITDLIKDKITVEKENIYEDKDTYYVYVLEDGFLNKTTLNVIDSNAVSVLVDSGIKNGDKIAAGLDGEYIGLDKIAVVNLK